jgi:hypothetical protein
MPEVGVVVGQVLGDRVVEAELATPGEHQDGGRGERLGDRADAKDCLGLDRDLGVDVGEAVALGQHGVALPHHHDRRTGDGLVGEGLRHHRVELGRQARSAPWLGII